MKENTFLAALAKLTKSYKWTVKDGNIRATNKDGKFQRGICVFNPITAVCRASRRGNFSTLGTAFASERLGIARNLSDNIRDAAEAKENRGYVQVLRGKIRAILKI